MARLAVEGRAEGRPADVIADTLSAAALAASAEATAFAAESADLAASILAFAAASRAFDFGGGENAKKLCLTGVPRAVLIPAGAVFAEADTAVEGLAVWGAAAGLAL